MALKANALKLEEQKDQLEVLKNAVLEQEAIYNQ